MRITQRDFRQLRHSQTEFDPCFAAIELHLRMLRLKEGIADWIETAIAVIPAPEFRVTGANVTYACLGEVDSQIVIVRVENTVAIYGESSLAHFLFVMQIRNAA